MFKFKRNFTFREPSVARTPNTGSLQRNEESPFKRIKLSSIRSMTPLPDPPEEKTIINNGVNNGGNVFFSMGNSKLNLVPTHLKTIDTSIQSRSSTPIGATEASIIDDKKIVHECKLDATLNQSVSLTPPPSPIDRFRYQLDILNREKANLQVVVHGLREQVEVKFNEVVETRKKIIDTKSKRIVLNDLMEIANNGQCEVRNMLNEIFNPGTELAERANVLMEETKRNHKTKLEKVRFELMNLFDSTRAAIERKEKELIHQIELNERTLMTLNDPEKSMTPDHDAELGILRPISPRQEQHQKQPERKTESPKTVSTEEINCHDDQTEDVDEDCVILDDTITQNVAGTPQSPTVADVEVPRAITNQSETTQSCDTEEDEEDDDGTDVEERSFTPCQAQRPV